MISIFFIAAVSITVKNVREKAGSSFRAPAVRELLQGLFHNDQALVVVITIVIFNASLYLTSNLAVYFFDYDIGNGALYGLFGIVGGATQILSMTMLPVLRRKWKRMTIFTGAILTTIIGYALLFLLAALQVNNIVCLCAAAVIIYFGFGQATVLTTVFLADSVDYGEWKTGRRSESITFSMQTFVAQLASAFSVLIAGVGLDIIHLDDKAAVQTDATLFGLHILMTVLPAFGLVISVIFFRKRYKLTDTFLTGIIEEIKGKRSGSNETTAGENETEGAENKSLDTTGV